MTHPPSASAGQDGSPTRFAPPTQRDAESDYVPTVDPPATAGRVAATFEALRYACLSALADLAVIYTWKTWTFGWLARVLCQVAFFALIGRLLQNPATTDYLLIGSAVVIVTMEAAFVTASSTWERGAGTLPLLVASPTGPFVVFVGRSVQWLISGTASANIALFALAPIFGVPLAFPTALAAVPLIVLVALSSYCFALLLAAFVLRVPTFRNIVGNITWWTIGLLGGVQVPVTFWPGWVGAIGEVLPLRHGLAGVRVAIAGGPAATILRDAGLEIAVGAGWLVVAALAFRRLAEGGRRTGSIEFGE
ncbi:MAG TPA: ABC transporter permease [Micromonosporaceae bacterium]|nr:ABC transporter permease [Micromonosporaceae bacterium]